MVSAVHCAVPDSAAGKEDGVSPPPGATPAEVLASKAAPQQADGAPPGQGAAASPQLPGSLSDPARRRSVPAPSPDTVLGVRL